MNDNLPRFHKEILTISLFNLKEIKEAYQKVLRLNYLDHLSINIINPNKEIIFLSSTPQTGSNVCSSDLWLQDSSIHPKTYEHQKFYFWEDCYAKDFKAILKKEKELKNGLYCGFICAQKVEEFYILYSFATRFSDPKIKAHLHSSRNILKEMGNYCYNNIKPLYQRLYPNMKAPEIIKGDFPQS